MIEIVAKEPNKKELNQWDVGRLVNVSGIDADKVHLANKGDSKALIMDVVDSQAKIPDHLLQTGKQLCVYAVKDGVTVERKIFFVEKREKPENYVYEDDQRNYIYELISKAETTIEGAHTAYENATNAVSAANTAIANANQATETANESANSATLAAKNANEAADKANHTAKSLMVVGSAEGESIYLDDAIDQFVVGLRVFGKTTQDGTPTPEAPVELESVENPTVTVNNQTLLVPYTLHGIPVTSGGNYTDTNGQQWICDEIDIARGMYVQRTKKITVSGASTEGWYVSNIQYVESATRFDIRMYDEPCAGSFFCLCNTYVGSEAANTGAETCWCVGDGTTDYLQFRICTAYASTVDNLKSILQANPAAFIYQLTTPIETPLSEEELATFATLRTNRGSTTVSNDASAHMEIEYVMDAKKYIDSKISSTILKATVE